MWNATGDYLGSQPGHRGAINFLSDFNSNLDLRFMQSKYSTVGVPMLLSVGADNIIKIWDMKRFKCVSEIQIGSATGPLTKAVWVGKSVVTASGGNIRFWDHKIENLNVSSSESFDKNNNSNSNGNGNGAESRGSNKTETATSQSEWKSRGLGSHAQTCTDLISTDSYVASSSKSGQIFRWSRV